MPLDLEHDADLRGLTTFGVPARARLLATLRDEADLPQALELAARGPLLMLSGGSNLLLTRDPDEPVLRMALRGIRTVGGGDEAVVEAAAGESWDGLVRATLAAGLCGLENLALIPGLVGASPIQNIGAYGVEMRERFESLRAVHLDTGEMREFDAAACRFGYRDSVFKTEAGRRWLILAVRFRLSRRAAPRLDYGELRAEIEARGGLPAGDGAAAARAVADAVTAIRRRKLPDPAELGNAGSFFKNPVVSAATAQALRARHPDLPVYPVAEGAAVVTSASTAASSGAGAGSVKLSAGWLIDRCGFKGARRGDAGVSPRHALVLVNHGQASGAQLLALAREIQAAVGERFGVRLEPEPVVV